MKHAYLFLAAILALIASRAGAMDYDVGPIHIAQPWTRATPKGAAVAGGYMKITNKGTESDRMSCVSATVATQCQIHNMTIEQGVAKMRPLPDGLWVTGFPKNSGYDPEQFQMVLLGNLHEKVRNRIGCYRGIHGPRTCSRYARQGAGVSATCARL
jgi:hypothetical protein